ncbi:MAG: peptide chain release factor 2 [Gammaproteobacteria bacterium]
MMDEALLKQTLVDCQHRSEALRGIFDLSQKIARFEEVKAALEDPSIWSNQEQAQVLGQERARLEKMINEFKELETSITDAIELLSLAVEEEDEATYQEVAQETKTLLKQIHEIEFQRMFTHAMDPNHAYMDIQSGSGGTEAQDWAEMLLRMYLRWAERRGFTTELVEASDGDVAGIRSATVKIKGDYAFGWLRTETGVHRLVRKSPFDSGNRRHTSFASVFVYPEVDDSIDIDINPADLRIDTYRASGAGGQHVNRTDSAVRITHEPSGIVVQCQADRSQHKNRAQAMKQLRAKLYEMELQKQQAEKQALEASKADIGWGSQIRSYVLDDGRIKDLRTQVETGNTQGVLDGDIDKFLEASLKAEV